MREIGFLLNISLDTKFCYIVWGFQVENELCCSVKSHIKTWVLQRSIASVYSIKQAYSFIRVVSLSLVMIVMHGLLLDVWLTGQTSVMFCKPTVHSDFIHLEISFPHCSLSWILLKTCRVSFSISKNILAVQVSNYLNWWDYISFLQFHILTSYPAILGFSKKEN